MEEIHLGKPNDMNLEYDILNDAIDTFKKTLTESTISPINTKSKNSIYNKLKFIDLILIDNYSNFLDLKIKLEINSNKNNKAKFFTQDNVIQFTNFSDLTNNILKKLQRNTSLYTISFFRDNLEKITSDIEINNYQGESIFVKISDKNNKRHSSHKNNNFNNHTNTNFYNNNFSLIKDFASFGKNKEKENLFVNKIIDHNINSKASNLQNQKKNRNNAELYNGKLNSENNSKLFADKNSPVTIPLKTFQNQFKYEESKNTVKGSKNLNKIIEETLNYNLSLMKKERNRKNCSSITSITNLEAKNETKDSELDIFKDANNSLFGKRNDSEVPKKFKIFRNEIILKNKNFPSLNFEENKIYTNSYSNSKLKYNQSNKKSNIQNYSTNNLIEIRENYNTNSKSNNNINNNSNKNFSNKRLKNKNKPGQESTTSLLKIEKLNFNKELNFLELNHYRSHYHSMKRLSFKQKILISPNKMRNIDRNNSFYINEKDINRMKNSLSLINNKKSSHKEILLKKNKLKDEEMENNYNEDSLNSSSYLLTNQSFSNKIKPRLELKNSKREIERLANFTSDNFCKANKNTNKLLSNLYQNSISKNKHKNNNLIKESNNIDQLNIANNYPLKNKSNKTNEKNQDHLINSRDNNIKLNNLNEDSSNAVLQDVEFLNLKIKQSNKKEFKDTVLKEKERQKCLNNISFHKEYHEKENKPNSSEDLLLIKNLSNKHIISHLNKSKKTEKLYFHKQSISDSNYKSFKNHFINMTNNSSPNYINKNNYNNTKEGNNTLNSNSNKNESNPNESPMQRTGTISPNKNFSKTLHSIYINNKFNKKNNENISYPNIHKPIIKINANVVNEAEKKLLFNHTHNANNFYNKNNLNMNKINSSSDNAVEKSLKEKNIKNSPNFESYIPVKSAIKRSNKDLLTNIKNNSRLEKDNEKETIHPRKLRKLKQFLGIEEHFDLDNNFKYYFENAEQVNNNINIFGIKNSDYFNNHFSKLFNTQDMNNKAFGQYSNSSTNNLVNSKIENFTKLKSKDESKEEVYFGNTNYNEKSNVEKNSSKNFNKSAGKFFGFNSNKNNKLNSLLYPSISSKQDNKTKYFPNIDKKTAEKVKGTKASIKSFIASNLNILITNNFIDENIKHIMFLFQKDKNAKFDLKTILNHSLNNENSIESNLQENNSNININSPMSNTAEISFNTSLKCNENQESKNSTTLKGEKLSQKIVKNSNNLYSSLEANLNESIELDQDEYTILKEFILYNYINLKALEKYFIKKLNRNDISLNNNCNSNFAMTNTRLNFFKINTNNEFNKYFYSDSNNNINYYFLNKTIGQGENFFNPKNHDLALEFFKTSDNSKQVSEFNTYVEEIVNKLKKDVSNFLDFLNFIKENKMNVHLNKMALDLIFVNLYLVNPEIKCVNKKLLYSFIDYISNEKDRKFLFQNFKTLKLLSKYNTQITEKIGNHLIKHKFFILKKFLKALVKQSEENIDLIKLDFEISDDEINFILFSNIKEINDYITDISTSNKINKILDYIIKSFI